MKTSRRFFNNAMLRRVTRISAIALVFFTVLGPFGTYDAFGIAGRITYWSALLVFCGLIFEFFVPLFLNNERLVRRTPRWIRFAAGVLVGSFFAIWIVFAIEYIARGAIDARNLPWLFICVAAIGSVMSFISFMPPFASVTVARNGIDIDYEGIDFFNRYPHLKGSRLCWITIEDHYARVVLDSLEVSLHTSMRELERQLEHYPGFRIHRSHWVAYDAVRGIKKNGRSTEIDMGGGIRLPVGGTYRRRVARLAAEITTSTMDPEAKPNPKVP